MNGLNGTPEKVGAGVPKLGANAPNLGANGMGWGATEALFGRVRLGVLSLLYAHPDESFHMRAIARWTGSGQGAVQRELRNLAGAGILNRWQQGRQVYYQANRQNPIFVDLYRLLVKTSGMSDVLRSALAEVRDRISAAFVYGSMAKGTATAESDVDMMVVGEVELRDLVAALTPVEQVLQREVNPSVYPPAEFRARLGDSNHFLTSVMREPKVFIIGDEDELARLAA
jgi:predicted nucleotidyltransferase